MAYDKDIPAASTSLRASNPQILANQSAIETAVDLEHAFTSGGAQTGVHAQGSARVFFQDAAPATQVGGGAFVTADLGSLWVDSNSSPDNQFNVLTATTPTWTPISTEVIAVLLAANRVFAGTLGVAGLLTASAALTVGTTLDVTGNIDPTTYETTNGGFLDEDAMGSDAADKVASQQSIKAYNDNTNADIVGTQTALDSVGGALADGVNYKATGSGGMVIASIGGGAEGSQTLTLLTDGNNPPVTTVGEAVGNAGAEKFSISWVIKEDNFWKYTTSGAAVPTIYWCPFGSGTAVIS